ncbi:MAG TPA: AAA family ATPase, partial [Chloroflexota bacterium]|nr:AAA family ATPase [Chloroflexota bacterium]
MSAPSIAGRGRQPDEIDAAIDSIFAKLGRNWKWILFWLVALGVVFFYIVPNWKTVSGPLMMVAQLLFQLLFAAFFLIIQFGALFWFLGRGRVYWIEPGESGIYFKDYKGNDSVLEVATRVVTLVRGVKNFKQMGGEVSRGLLLVGPPGTGKSYLAQAISAEAGVPFCYASAPSFQNMFFGVGNMRVMMLYKKARKKALKYGACILFIDEIDAMGGARGGMGGGMGMMGGMMGGGSGMLNELLLQMDPPNIETGAIKKFLRKIGLRRAKVLNPPVLTIGATNLPEVLDPALLRPGRFDRQIRIDKPDLDGRKEVIEYYLAKVKHVPEMPMEKMANDTIDYTPVAIKYVINEAVVNAHFEGKDRIDYKDFTRAREYHEWGLRQPIKGMNVEEKRRIAYHETGHAFAQIKLEPKERLSKVTIIRHGSALGLSAAKPLEEQYLKTKEQLLADIQISLASKAAERIFLGTETTGMGGDLPAASRMAAYYLGMCGMGGTLYAPLAFGQWQPDGELKHQIEVLLDEQYKKVKILLEANRESVTAIAEALLVREELDGDEVVEILREVEERVARRAADEREAAVLVGAATGPVSREGNGHGETAIGPDYESPNGGLGNGNGHA